MGVGVGVGEEAEEEDEAALPLITIDGSSNLSAIGRFISPAISGSVEPPLPNHSRAAKFRRALCGVKVGAWRESCPSREADRLARLIAVLYNTVPSHHLHAICTSDLRLGQLGRFQTALATSNAVNLLPGFIPSISTAILSFSELQPSAGTWPYIVLPHVVSSVRTRACNLLRMYWALQL